MRCAIYTRVSTDEQATSEYSSLRRKEEARWNSVDIQAEKSWKVAGVYEDPGYSGKDFQRPGIQELLEDVRAGKLDAVVTYKIDRVSRSLNDFYEFWETLKAHGVTLVSATQHFDTSDSSGMLMLNILLRFAQFERELTRERTMSKMTGRAEKGLRNGGNVPLRHDCDKPTQTPTLNAAEVPTVRFFFQRMIETRSTCTVANEANARGYLASCGSSGGGMAPSSASAASGSTRRTSRLSCATRSTRASSATAASSIRPGTSPSSIRTPGSRPTGRTATAARTTTGSTTATTTSTC